MLPRPAMIATLLGASIGVPYVMSNTDADSAASAADQGAKPGTVNARPISSFGGTRPGNGSYGNSTRPNGVPVYSLAEVMRWEVNREWIYARWPRKSTGLGDPQRFGVRVPLVTGTRVHDLAGSLTYYFGTDGRVEHISFRGRTGDTSQIVQLVISRFGLQPVATPAPGEQLLRLGQGKHLKSQLRTRTESVLWSKSPHKSFIVELELERPDTKRFFEDSALRLPSVIAGVPVHAGQIQQAEPYAVGPIGAFAYEPSNSAVGDSSSSGSSKQAQEAVSKAAPEPEVADAAEPKVEVNLGIRRRMRWGS